MKIFTWRANGDGIGLGKHTLLEGDFYIHLYTYSVQGDNHRLTGWSNQCNQVLAKPKSNILRLTVQTFVVVFSNTSPQTRSSGLKMTPPTQGAGAFAGVDSIIL